MSTNRDEALDRSSRFIPLGEKRSAIGLPDRRWVVYHAEVGTVRRKRPAI
jgi:hypothetical protein